MVAAVSYGLRPATAKDREWMRQLHHATMRGSVETIWGWDESLQDSVFDRQFDPSTWQVVLVEGEDVGVIQVERRQDELVLSSIQVAPTRQGRGLGTALIRDLQAEGLPVGLQVLKTNERARRLYDGLGFQTVEHTPTHIRMRWEPVTGA